MINIIWIVLIFLGIIYSKLNGNNINILESGSKTFDLIIKLLPIMAIWLGLMNIAEKSGLLKKISNLLKPVLRFLFPEIPKNHKSFDYIASNLVANFFGLGSSSTPLGLKAIKELDNLNNSKTASKSMITFLVLNTTGLTLFPTTIISLRYLYKSTNPEVIIKYCFLSTLIGTIGGLFINYLLSRRYKS